MQPLTNPQMIENVLSLVFVWKLGNLRLFVQGLWQDYHRRSAYIAYLTRSKQELNKRLAFLRRRIDYLQREKAILR